ncbi:hypothetical protein P691DRAFT_657134 [Macrolepiota fuliginosa MF-IS2]|uniref:Cyclin N-terminal domain-containing protein n=1 Tax=Macrolepiota fuliginosa MF-IS2 TaxID=1400762 RepID=A0A9P5XNW0_9AGAR|nr:hypothetical protein P691DRAFT_657134 [Macrolepiota fuliginosa MF-IS2]
MHAFTHSLAHRAPPATRTRVRWQPYNTLSAQSTPSSSISSPSNTPLPENKLPNPSNPSQNPKESLPRDSSKKQFALGLVDQAVKTLGEIWRPQDIPLAFATSSRPGTILSGLPEPLSNNHVPGPGALPPSPSGCGADARGNFVPIKGFVHEVIRRSRTSGCVLQTALCYLEAIRPRVPELVRKEQAGEGVRGEPDISARILPATELELKLEEDHDLNPSAGSITPITALPSPLLCPRRTFLASLILASKFTQDKCYSNRAWAKLSGLSAREVGRCERALGEALEWRLWVGKSPAQSSLPSGPAVANPPSSRPVVRSQSEGNIVSFPSTRSPFLDLPPSVLAQVPAMYADVLSQSPSPDNPGLSYSPSSTESSSGDRTIQMSTFIDEPMATYSGPQAPAATDFWPCSDGTEVPPDGRNSSLVYLKGSQVGKAPTMSDKFGVYVFPPGAITSGDQLLAPGYPIPSNPRWLVESEILRSLPVMTQ